MARTTPQVDGVRLVLADGDDTPITVGMPDWFAWIAISTVKTHTNSIFSKLQVTSQTQAIARARELRLL